LDANNDGVLTLAEFSAGIEAFSTLGGAAGEEWDGSHLIPAFKDGPAEDNVPFAL